MKPAPYYIKIIKNVYIQCLEYNDSYYLPSNWNTLLCAGENPSALNFLNPIFFSSEKHHLAKYVDVLIKIIAITDTNLH